MLSADTTTGIKGGTMSKLLEKLERLSEGRAQPMGFEAARTREKPSKMLIVANVPVGNTELTNTMITENVDALLFSTENWKKEKSAVTQASKALKEVPWGVALSSATKDEIGQLIKMKCDFVILKPEKTPASILKEEDIGKVLQIDPSLEEKLVRTIGRLSINAVLLSPASGNEYPLTVHQIMVYEHLVGGTGKHILAAMPTDMPTDDLENLWNLGTRGIVVDITDKNSVERLSQIKEAIDKLPTTKKKTSDKFSALLPRAAGESAPIESDEDDDF